jgi:hypothetical protein
MSAILGFVVGVVSTLFASLVLYGVGRFQRRRRLKGIDRAVPIARGKAVIVTAGYVGLKPDWPDDLFVHEEAVYAAKRLSSLLAKYGTEHEYRIDRQLGREELCDLEICIGGPAANYRTKYYLDSYCRSLYYSLEKTLDKNEAVIAKISVPHGPRTRVVILLYGNVSFDTMSAVAYFCNHFETLAGGDLRPAYGALRLRTEPELGMNDARRIAYVEENEFTLGHVHSKSFGVQLPPG